MGNDEPDGTGNSPRPPEFKLTQLTGSYEAFGVAMDFLSRIEPFSDYDVGNFSRALRRQLATGQHVAALEGLRLVGFCGWLATTKPVAEAWVKGTGLLLPADEGADAVALTVVAADGRPVLNALLRRAREMNPALRVYFKREYADRRQTARKSSVENVGSMRKSD